jgi:hypothetical protein
MIRPPRQYRPPLPPVEGQLAFYGIDDPLWLPTLLACLARGGCVMVERTGDLLILPPPATAPAGLDSAGRLDT